MHILWVLEEGGSSTRHKGIVYTGRAPHTLSMVGMGYTQRGGGVGYAIRGYT